MGTFDQMMRAAVELRDAVIAAKAAMTAEEVAPDATSKEAADRRRAIRASARAAAAAFRVLAEAAATEANLI